MKVLISYKDLSGNHHTGMICDSAVTRAKDPFFMPDDREWYGIHLYGVRINRLGKGISKTFADRYYDECLSAVHPYAVNPEDKGAERWARDGALIIGESSSSEEIIAAIKEQIDNCIVEFSKTMTLKTGDIILIGDLDTSFLIASKSYDIMIPDYSGCPGFKLKIR